jgi:hypothetical protein
MGGVMKWLKEDFGLGHGHASAVGGVLLRPETFKTPKIVRVNAVFSGQKAGWKSTREALLETVQGFGDDGEIVPTDTSVSLLRGAKKFAIVQPGSGRLDLGFKRKGIDATGRFEAAAGWNSMVTHRVRIAESAQVDGEILGWLRLAYEGAK